MNIIDNYDSIMLYDDTIMHIDEVDTYISGDFSEEKLAELLSVITYKSSDLYEIEDDDWALQYAERWWELEERIYELIKNILNEQNNHGANYTIEGIGLYLKDCFSETEKIINTRSTIRRKYAIQVKRQNLL